MPLLYAAKGGNLATSDLYTLDPATAAETSIGPTGVALTGLAFDPSTGTLYGATTPNSAVHPNALVTLDVATGTATYVAAFDLTTITDITFLASGQLLGLLNNGSFVEIDKVTAAVTEPSSSGLTSTYGNGCAVDSHDDFYAFPKGAGYTGSAPPGPGSGFNQWNSYYSANHTTGALTAVGELTGGPVSDGAGVNAATFDASGTCWQIWNDFPACYLVTADIASGVCVAVAALSGTKWDALAWDLGGTPVHFHISASPSSFAAPPGSTTITATLTSGPDDTATLSASGQPAGMTISFTPAAIDENGGTSTMHVAVSGVAPGIYHVVVIATDSDETRSVGVDISVGIITPGTSPADAGALTPFCAQAIFGNAGGAHDPIAGDLILGAANYTHRVWFKLTNTTSVKEYARFHIHNPNAFFVQMGAALYFYPPLVDITDAGVVKYLEFRDNTTADQQLPATTLNPNSDAFRALGCTLNPGQTVYLQMASWGADVPWPTLQLTWQLLDETLHDWTNALDPRVALNPPIVQKWPLTTFSAIDYIHHDGHHFAAAPSAAGHGDMSTFPGGTDYPALTVHRCPDDGSSLDTIDVRTNFWWDWDQNAYSFGFPDLCTFATQLTRTGWHADVGTAKFASDGTTLWLGVICREEREYPWYHQRSATPYIPDPATFEAFTAGFNNYLNYSGSFFCSGDGLNPFDDLGFAASQRWHPYSLVMFVWDGAGFTRIGEVVAKFVNADQNMAATSEVSLAASPAEPGVCHAMWAEAGVWGERDPGPGEWPNRGSRLNYSRWSSGGKTLDVDQLFYDQIFDRNPYPPAARPSSPTWNGRRAPDGVTLDSYGPDLDETNYMSTPSFVLKNDHGFPVAFVSRVKIGLDTSSGDPMTYTHFADNCEATLRMWDLRSVVTNAPAEMQQITPDLLPQPVETQWQLPRPPTNPGFTIDRLYAQLIGTDTSVGSGLNWRGFAISPRYLDPLLANTGVYLLNVRWQATVYVGNGQAQGFYRVPCDGSAPFTLMDGARDISILPNATHLGSLGTPFFGEHLYVPIADFFSEPRNIWTPAGGFKQAEIILDRVCTDDWMDFDWPGSIKLSLPVTVSSVTPPRTVYYYDPVADVFYYVAFWVDPNTAIEYEVIARTGILRKVVICSIGDCAVASSGLHVDDRVHW